MLPHNMVNALLQDAIHRDMTTARRAILSKILWNERFLTRSQLIARVEYQLGKGCFGAASWEDIFYRDMRAVKNIFQAAGLQLRHSRMKDQPGYFIQGQGQLSQELMDAIKASAAEVDQRQIDIYKTMSPAARFRQGCAISDAARNALAYRIREGNPKLTRREAQKLALQRSYVP